MAQKMCEVVCPINPCFVSRPAEYGTFCHRCILLIAASLQTWSALFSADSSAADALKEWKTAGASSLLPPPTHPFWSASGAPELAYAKSMALENFVDKTLFEKAEAQGLAAGFAKQCERQQLELQALKQQVAERDATVAELRRQLSSLPPPPAATKTTGYGWADRTTPQNGGAAAEPPSELQAKEIAHIRARALGRRSSKTLVL